MNSLFNCNLRVTVYPRVLLLINTHPIFQYKFLRTRYIHTYCYIIHQLKVIRKPRVRIHLRIIYLLPTISLTILLHEKYHTFQPTLLLKFLSNYPFATFFLFLQYHTLVMILSQITLLFMLSLCRLEFGGQRLNTIISR